MKMTIDIPADMLEQLMKFTRAKTKREAVVTAIASFNRLERLKELNSRIRGSFRDFMTAAELKQIRAIDTVRRSSHN